MAVWRVRGVGLPDGDDLDAGVDGAGRWTPRPPVGAEPLPGRFALPGLVDAHCHLSLGWGPDERPVALEADAMRANLAAAHAAGVTGIRDTGSPGSITLQLIGTPDEAGLVACGRFLAPPNRFFPGAHDPVSADTLVDAALAEVRAGARWVKIIADFPTLHPDAPMEPSSPTYPVTDIEQVVAAVHAAGARVAAHTTTPHAAALIAAGIDSVEHGTALTEADLDQLAARGAAWTPTLSAVLAESPHDPPEKQRFQCEVRDRLRTLLPAAVRLGVTVLTGTDVVGTIPREVALLTELGLTPTEALTAATTAGREFLHFPDLHDGRPVDLVTYADDPRDDPAVLAHPAAVIRHGARLR
jgi:imidazolonepropionase-like amidohydrolase